ncbi:MAG TPA: DUF2252 family protein [Baekduia sp.]
MANFGVFAALDRRLVFDINDFDETHPAPFEWDVKRLAASMFVAARKPRVIGALCGGRRRHDPHQRDAPPLIVHPDAAEIEELDRLVHGGLAAYVDSLAPDPTAADLPLPLCRLREQGRRRRVGRHAGVHGEAQESVLAPYVDPVHFASQGQRVVGGQQLVQAASDLGSRATDPCARRRWRAYARSDRFDRAITSFADQTDRDHAAMLDAIRDGRLPAIDNAY